MNKKNQEPKEEMLAQSSILEMGWTKTMIPKFLPEPVLKTNPFYKSAPPMKLWKKQDVLAVMETEEFKVEFEKAAKRKAASQKAQNTKYNKLVDEMKQISDSITVEVIPQDRLEIEALNHKKLLICYYEPDGDLSPKIYEIDKMIEKRKSDDPTLQRWVVNYIRHNLIRYDESLLTLKGRVGKDYVYVNFKTEILEKIAKAYPFYADECYRQIDKTMSKPIY